MQTLNKKKSKETINYDNEDKKIMEERPEREGEGGEE